MSLLADKKTPKNEIPIYRNFLADTSYNLSINLGVCSRKSDNEAFEVLNNNKFTFVNVCFQYKCNEISGLYRQTLAISEFSY